jgi:hypothetical protein
MDLDHITITGDGSRDPDRVKGPIAIERTPVESHMVNFLRCVRTRETPRASVDNGFQHAVAGCMAAVSLETGRRVRFDADRLELS